MLREANAKIPPMADLSRYIEALNVINGITGVVGFGLTIWAIVIAKGARKAAQEAREAALLAARRRSLIEELEYMRRLIHQVGTLIQQEEWHAVQMQTVEIVGACKSAMARWGDGLSEQTRNGVLTASTLLGSVAAKSSEYANRAVTTPEKNKLTSTHLRASGFVHDALGEAHRLDERDGMGNADTKRLRVR